MENLVTTQDTISKKIPEYVDLAEVVTEEDADFIVEAPRSSHLKAGDVVEVNERKATVVQTVEWVKTDGDMYKFLNAMFQFEKISFVWKRTEMRWDD